MYDVVITAGTAIGSVLALAEAIKKDISCHVFVLGTSKKTTSVIGSSKFVDEVFCIDSSEHGEYVRNIQEWYEAQKFKNKPVLYSTTDTSCFLIDKDRDWFENKFILSLPSSETIKTYTNKGLAESAAREAGLVVPKTAVLTKNTDLKKELLNFDFPVILKPRAAYLKGSLDFKIKVIPSLKTLLDEADKYLQQGDDILCQEYIKGDNNSAFYYIFYRSKTGEVISSMGIKTLQSTPKGGVMLKGRSYYHANLEQQCQAFLKKIDYQGIGGIEFKKQGDLFYFIEMSVRLEGFYKIAEATDVPVSVGSYKNLTEEKELESVRQKDDVVYISWLPTMLYYVKYRDVISLFQNFIASLLHPKYIINVFSIRSPLPFIKDICFSLFGRKK